MLLPESPNPNLRVYIVCDLDDNRLKMTRELGATVTLNPERDDVVTEVMKITGDRGVDVAIEVVGHPLGIKMVGSVIKNNRAKIIMVGWHQAPDTYELFSWIRSPIIYSPRGIGMSTDHQSELTRAMWALQKGIYPMNKLVTTRATSNISSNPSSTRAIPSANSSSHRKTPVNIDRPAWAVPIPPLC